MIGWISVKDRLPADIKDVLGYSECNGTCRVIYYSKGSAAWFTSESNKRVDDGVVTHWMYLPDLPDREG